MRVLICFLAAVSICAGYYDPRGRNGPVPPTDGAEPGDARQGSYGYGCCAIKAVETNETAFEMFALFDGYPYYEMPDFCNSYCVYVKMSELKPLLEQMNNMRQDDSSMMEEMLENDQWTMMQWQDDSSMMEEMLENDQWTMMQ